MEQGRVSQVGTPRDLYDRPANRFTASFVGVSNRRETVIEWHERGPTIRWGSTVLHVNTNGDLPHGTPVTAVWRPEAATIAGSTSASPNLLHGRIELLTFLGPVTRLDVLVDDDPEPVIVDLASQLAYDLGPGQAVAISVPPAAIRVYPAASKEQR